jgi:hypothetical protein
MAIHSFINGMNEFRILRVLPSFPNAHDSSTYIDVGHLVFIWGPDRFGTHHRPESVMKKICTQETVT